MVTIKGVDDYRADRFDKETSLSKYMVPYLYAENLEKEAEVLSNATELKEGTYSSYWALYGDNQSIIEGLSKIKYELQNLYHQ